MDPITEKEIIEKINNKVLRFQDLTLLSSEQTEAICLAAVGVDGTNLRYISCDRQTHEMCLSAVKQNGMALKYAEVHTEDICLAAVKQNGWALEFVENQTDEICFTSIRGCANNIVYVKNQTERLCLEAVTSNPYSLKYINKQTEAICLAALEHDAYLGVLFSDPEIYRKIYNKKHLKDFYQESLIYKSEVKVHYNLNKILEILLHIDSNHLIDFFKNDDVGIILTETDFKNCPGLRELKLKAEMLDAIGDVAKILDRDDKNTKKPKII